MYHLLNILTSTTDLLNVGMFLSMMNASKALYVFVCKEHIGHWDVLSHSNNIVIKRSDSDHFGQSASNYVSFAIIIERALGYVNHGLSWGVEHCSLELSLNKLI